MKSKYKILLLAVLTGVICLIFVQSSLAFSTTQSNESIQAKESLAQAEKDILEMMEKNISINRVNETYQEALQLYSAQLALEGKGGKANYGLIIEHVSEIDLIKENSLEASDELKIFVETYLDAGKTTNLSEMQEDYNTILASFQNERFEDTPALINQGYNRISEIQSSQTALNSFYMATSGVIKNFFIKNYLKLLIICSITLLFILFFWNNLKKLRMRMKFNHLTTQKKALNTLIQNMQKSYFKTKKLSETEYTIKLKKFKELIRDIDRQIMILKEDIFKTKRRK
ncbi:hypothetical protein K9K77_03520 [Candidatus Babeliales bacterium]|nr:hypothetical protein [Candidatus Babeliales bacterium]